MARQLQVIDGRVSDYVLVPRTALVEPAIDVQALSDELGKDLAAIYAYVWSGKRLKALNALSGLQLSVAGVRRTFHDFAGYVEDLPAESTSRVA